MTRIPRHFQLELKQGNNLGTTKGITDRTKKNCFRYLKLMSPLNAAISSVQQ